MSFKSIVVLMLGIIGMIHGYSLRGQPDVVRMTAPGRAPKPCVAPKQFQTSITQFTMPGFQVIMGNLSYDAVGQRVRVFERLVTPKQPNFIIDQLILYKQGIVYVRDVVKGTCQKFSIPRVFPAFQVPPNATYVAGFTMGQSLHLDTWTFKAGPIGIYQTWTRGSCWPVTTESVSAQPQGVANLAYLNMTLGIRSSSAWTIPKGCHSASWSPSYIKSNFGANLWPHGL